MTGRRALFLGILAAWLVASACGGSGDSGGGGPVPGAPAPDFALKDLNPNSATHQADVSPRQHIGRVSAWYFGHAT
jgi:hypothetical protein